MTTRMRVAVFAVSGCGLALLLAWGVAGLPAFGHYGGTYGKLVVQVAPGTRHIANTVTAVVFDIRGFDTLGEELILLAAASASAMLLREIREGSTVDVVDAVRSNALAGAGVVAVPAVFLLGLQVVAHGLLTPGGGFQGGLVLASAFAVVFTAVEYGAFHTLARPPGSEAVEGAGVIGFVGIGLVALGVGSAFLQNLLPAGRFGTLLSGGSVSLVNWSSALAICGAFLVVFNEFVKEPVAARHHQGGS